ncbi:uncharacterized protein LOC141909508 isoform X2 [Tubulanus polymorphus]|uniref:uncharacterized protein LOC141909508 isoform X2 n=1 Tax=Tubulanus polymorphus TaxID=672921 RepID=UPI003DA43C19
MSSVIPILSSSPPPLDDSAVNDDVWNDDDDDDEFGRFTSANHIIDNGLPAETNENNAFFKTKSEKHRSLDNVSFPIEVNDNWANFAESPPDFSPASDSHGGFADISSPCSSGQLSHSPKANSDFNDYEYSANVDSGLACNSNIPNELSTDKFDATEQQSIPSENVLEDRCGNVKPDLSELDSENTSTDTASTVGKFTDESIIDSGLSSDISPLPKSEEYPDFSEDNRSFDYYPELTTEKPRDVVVSSDREEAAQADTGEEIPHDVDDQDSSSSTNTSAMSDQPTSDLDFRESIITPSTNDDIRGDAKSFGEELRLENEVHVTNGNPNSEQSTVNSHDKAIAANELVRSSDLSNSVMNVGVKSSQQSQSSQNEIVKKLGCNEFEDPASFDRPEVVEKTKIEEVTDLDYRSCAYVVNAENATDLENEVASNLDTPDVLDSAEKDTATHEEKNVSAGCSDEEFTNVNHSPMVNEIDDKQVHKDSARDHERETVDLKSIENLDDIDISGKIDAETDFDDFQFRPEFKVSDQDANTNNPIIGVDENISEMADAENDFDEFQSPQELEIRNQEVDDHKPVEDEKVSDMVNAENDFDDFQFADSQKIEFTSFADNFGSVAKPDGASDWAAFATSDDTADNGLTTASTEESDWASFAGPSDEPLKIDQDNDVDDDDFGGFEEATRTTIEAPAHNFGDFEDCDNSFGDFDSSAVKPSVESLQKNHQNSVTVQSKISIVISKCFTNDDDEDSIGATIYKLAEVIIKDRKVIVNKDEKKTEGKHKNKSSQIQMLELNVWKNLYDSENTNALTHQWADSKSYGKLLTALHIDPRNILHGHKKPAIPIFAANLGLLEPSREPVQKIEPQSDATLVDTSKESPTQQHVPLESIPPVEFDWGSSGLTNPLDTLESEFLSSIEPPKEQTETKPINALESILASMKPTMKVCDKNDENLTAEATSILATLQNLSFMQAGVLMFPLTSPTTTDTSPSQEAARLSD